MKNHQSKNGSCFQLKIASERNRISIFLLLIFSIFSLCASAFQLPQEKVLDIEKIESITDSFAGKVIGIKEVPGMSVAVAQNGKIVFQKSYGKADVEMGTNVNANTMFGLSSITKQFTAATIMRLVEKGEISLDDPVTKFLPDYPTQGKTVTIHHLLSHTSGMKDYGLRNEELPGWYGLELPYQKMIELWANMPFDNEPGEVYDYNNWGYYLLGQIIERVTGTPWSKYGEPELLKPLGLNNILFAHQLRIVPGRAKGYLHQQDSLINVPYRNIEVFSAGGGLSSTIEDLITWTHLFHNGKVVSGETVEKMTTPKNLNNGKKFGYGYGFYVNELRGHLKIYHGGTFGFGTYVSHYPAENITIAILSNSTKGRERAEQLEKALATELLNIKIKDLPLTAREIDRYSGVYTYQSTPTKIRELKIFGENSRLYAQIGESKPFQLRSQGDHKFIPVSAGITDINFKVEKGIAQGLTIHEGAWEITPANKTGTGNAVKL